MHMKTHDLQKTVVTKFVFAIALLSLLSIANAQSSKLVPSKQNNTTTAKVYTTAQNTTYRLSPVEDVQFTDPGDLVERKVFIFLDDSRSFQTMLGIGGAITDASAETFAKLTAEQQRELLKVYYDPKEGIGYTLARTNIQSCDFSSGSYTYVDNNDKDLKSFSIKHDEQYRIPLIKKAIATAGAS